jgi:CRP/FNR family transcriptional regulator, cyclic AMP receptor protein
VNWALLTELPEPERRSLLSLARRHRFAKGEVVFHEGDPGETLHLIERGRAAVRLTTPFGDVHIVRVIPAGGWFGELALISGSPRNATVTALQPLETMALHRSHLDEVRGRFPAFDQVLAGSLVNEVRRLSTALLEALFIPVEQRTYRRIAELVPLFGGGAPPVVIPLTQEEVAQVVGTTRPTVNKVLQAAAAAGILRIRRGHIEVLDLDQLARRAR